MSAASDRNLLFGVLAVQMDFVDREALLQGMHSWVLNKSKSLGQILVHQSSLSRDECELLDAIVDKHVSRHAEDIQQSLTAVHMVASVRDVLGDLRSLADPELSTSVSCLVDDTPPLPPPQAVRAETGPRPQHGTSADVRSNLRKAERFQILARHASGGLGDVYLARDLELNRDVALKEMQERVADDPVSRGRFVLEPEVTGSLEHPGIVPVYSMGHDSDQRPYYAMRFIRGKSLADAIDEFHAQANVDWGEKERTLALRQLLGQFVDVCNAIAYAHSRGVLHRDLKPSNVMLGPYGETLVVDWGLAKIVARGDEPHVSGEDPLQPSALMGSSATVAGTAMGTPAYMSPEQASGMIHELGPASDVYSLGATLYKMLTGNAPVGGEDLEQALTNVREGNILPPRSVNPLVPLGLDAICRRAMALDPAHRYSDCGQLITDIEAWLADEPTQAYEEPVTVRSRRWLRKHPRMVTGITVTLVAGLISLITVSVLVTQSNQALATANTNLHIANEAERTARTEADAFADVSLAAATDLTRRAKDLEQIPQSGPIRQRLLEGAAENFSKLSDLQATSPKFRSRRAASLLALGTVQDQLGQRQTAITTTNVGVDLLRSLVDEYPVETRYAAALAEALNQLGALYQAAGNLSAAETTLTDALRIVQTPPLDVLPTRPTILMDLAQVQNDRGYREQAQSLFEQVLRLLADAAANEFPKERAEELKAVANAGLGVCLAEQGRYQEAKPCLEQGIELLSPLLAAVPGHRKYRARMASCHMNLAIANTADKAAAKGHLKSALELVSALHRDFPADIHYVHQLVVLHTQYAHVERENANKHFTKARAAYTGLDPEDQANLEMKICIDEGLVWASQGRMAEARDKFQRAREQFDLLSETRQRTFQNQKRLAQVYTYLANYGELTLLEEAINILNQLLESSPEDALLARSLAWAYANRATHLSNSAETLAQAVDDFQRAIDAMDLAVEAVRPTEYELFQAKAYLGWANSLIFQRNFTEAQERIQQSLEHAEQLLRTDANHAEGIDVAVRAYRWLAQVCLRVGDHESAFTAIQHGAELANDTAETWFKLALLMCQCVTTVRGEQTLPDVQRSERVDQCRDEAVRMLQKAIESGFSDAQRLESQRAFAELDEHDGFRKILEDLRR